MSQMRPKLKARRADPGNRLFRLEGSLPIIKEPLTRNEAIALLYDSLPERLPFRYIDTVFGTKVSVLGLVLCIAEGGVSKLVRIGRDSLAKKGYGKLVKSTKGSTKKAGG